MRNILLLFILTQSLTQSLYASYTEFYCQTTGSNLNSGSTANDSATYTGVGDSDGTNVFTPSDGSTPASTVNVGDWASVYVTSGATVATFIGRVTAVAAGANGAITVSTTAKSGTFPSDSAGAHTITCKVGGAWKGPNAGVGFPFAFANALMTDASGNTPRVNFKSGTTYSITSGISTTTNGPIRFQGYAASVGDGGKATIDGGTTQMTILTISGTANELVDFIFSNNGTAGSATGVNVGATACLVHRCVFHDIRGSGLTCTGTGAVISECEAYTCNTSNTADLAGISVGGGSCINSISHDNTTANGSGFRITSSETMVSCVADTNTKDGFHMTAASHAALIMVNCDAYNSGASGLDFTTAFAHGMCIKNCNFVKNGTYGINSSGQASKVGLVLNCGFGTGTQANVTADILSSLVGVHIVGSVSYGANLTPWVDPANGDFRITLAAAKNAGRGQFTQTASSYAGTVAYPDIGAASATTGGGSFTWAQ